MKEERGSINFSGNHHFLIKENLIGTMGDLFVERFQHSEIMYQN